MQSTNQPKAPICRFDASQYLDALYKKFLKANNLQDNQRPDWYSILVENARDPLSQSAIKKGCPRGNRGAYGRLPFFSFGGRPHYLRRDLRKWFKDHFEHRILNRAEAA